MSGFLLKPSKIIVVFTTFGQMTAVIFLILGDLKLSATVAFSANTFGKTKRVN